MLAGGARLRQECVEGDRWVLVCVDRAHRVHTAIADAPDVIGERVGELAWEDEVAGDVLRGRSVSLVNGILMPEET